MTDNSSPLITHKVFNQAPVRSQLNEYLTNPVLVAAVKAFKAEWANEQLSSIGEKVGSEEFQQDAELCNRNQPALQSHDRYGNRIDQVIYHPSYHKIISAAVSAGAHTSAWKEPKSGANVARASAFMLFAQVEPGHACPISMTHAVVPSLEQSPELNKIWQDKIFSTEYDSRMLSVAQKTGAIFGMAMTEKQGGSDVRANTTEAVLSDRNSSEYRITGHKWFCSAPMSDAFLVLAQIKNAESAQLSCFLVPRVLEDGSLNTFRIQRLKDKLGNQSNASSEIELSNTVGFLVGEAGRGVRTIIEMVSRTRLDCVLGSAAGMRQGVAEALWHARHRSAFGAKLIDQPAMTAVLADLALESEAATLTALRLARAHDVDAPESDLLFRRLATAVSKYWICKRGPNHAYESMECLGGNGYTETFPLARRYREQPVMAIWEGSGNVIALDVLRALVKEPESLAAFLAELELSSGIESSYDDHLGQIKSTAVQLISSDQDQAARLARGFVEDLALALQSSLMLRYADANSAQAFLEARIGKDRGHEYGQLPITVNLKNILSRH